MTSKNKAHLRLPELKLIAETFYKKLYYSMPDALLYQEWKSESLTMDYDAFRTEAGLFVETVLDFRPAVILTNQEDFNYILSEENNQWYLQNLIPVLQNTGVKKIAIVGNDSLLNYIQLENLAESVRLSYGNLPVESLFFDDIERAIHWLKK